MSASDTSIGQVFANQLPILITGGTGFIGRHVVHKLLSSGFHIRLPYRENAPSQWRDIPQIELIKVDNLELAPLEPLVEGCGSIVHLAGLAHTGGADRADASLKFARVNSELTARLVEAVHHPERINFIHMSSLAAVTANASEIIVDDLTEREPVTTYGQSKRIAEQHVHKLVERGGFAISLRPPLVIGAEAKGNWHSLQKLAATGLPLPFSTIRAKRSFISAQSLTEVVALLASRFWPASLSGNYCIADPEPLQLPEVLTELRHGMGLARNLLPCPALVFDILGAVSGRRRQLAGLTGSLEVDASRFANTFKFVPYLPIRQAIYRSGIDFNAQKSARSSAKTTLAHRTQRS